MCRRLLPRRAVARRGPRAALEPATDAAESWETVVSSDWQFIKQTHQQVTEQTLCETAEVALRQLVVLRWSERRASRTPALRKAPSLAPVSMCLGGGRSKGRHRSRLGGGGDTVGETETHSEPAMVTHEEPASR